MTAHDAESPAAIALLGVPSCAGARRPGLDEGPAALRAAGLVAGLEAAGFAVADAGDLPPTGFRPDPAHPRAQNAAAVAQVARAVGFRIEAAVAGGAFPLVLGGDCSISLGVVAGLLGRGGDLGVVWFDGDLDLNTPETTPSGFFDGMVTAHLLGRGSEEVARLGPRYPLLDESRLVYFGYNERDGGIDPPELAALEASAALRYPLEAVRRDPPGTAREALAALAGRVDRLLVHFDLDVTDSPAVDVPHRHGLALDAAAAALEVFLASPACAGLVVAEYNPPLDAGRRQARRLVERLAAALAYSRLPAG